jgi:hypothetical protein
MIGVLIIMLSVLFAGALPWWPYSASGRLQHRRPWDWLMDQDRNTGHVEIRGFARREGCPTVAEQLARFLKRALSEAATSPAKLTQLSIPLR